MAEFINLCYLACYFPSCIKLSIFFCFQYSQLQGQPVVQQTSHPNQSFQRIDLTSTSSPFCLLLSFFLSQSLWTSLSLTWERQEQSPTITMETATLSVFLSSCLFFYIWLFFFSTSQAKTIFPAFPSSLIQPEQIFRSQDGSSNELYETRFFTQTLDHFTFNPQSYNTFQQRYLINRTHWGGHRLNAPIFVYTGNEGDIEWFTQNTGFMFEIAPRFKALLIFIEVTIYTCCSYLYIIIRHTFFWNVFFLAYIPLSA